MSATGTRDHVIDILRGLAIFLMVQGNMAGSLFPHPWPAWGDWYMAIGSFVPALFVTLAGMSVVLTTIRKQYRAKHYVLRAGALLLTASLIVDVFVWGFIPFISVDVLYLIALSLPISYGFQFLKSWTRWLVVGVLFLGTPLLQIVLGYIAYPTELPIAALLAGATFNIEALTILKHWVIDGWFPIFPWLGFALLGVNIGLMRWRSMNSLRFDSVRMVLIGSALLAAGLALWTTYAGPLYVRGGFSEIIYPPTIAYVVTAMAQMLLLAALVERIGTCRVLQPLKVFGSASLFMFWFHFGLIELLPASPPLVVLIGFFIATLAFMFWIGYLIQKMRTRYPRRPWWVRYVLGI